MVLRVFGRALRRVGARARSWVAATRRGPRTSRGLRVSARVLLVYLAAAVVVAPMAGSLAVDRTELQELVGITPVTLTLTTAGHSELRLGVAGTVFVPRSKGPLGVVATVNSPATLDVGSSDLASYVTPHMLRLYAGLFHDPGPAMAKYVDLLEQELLHELLVVELGLTAVAGTTLLALVLLLRRPKLRAGTRRPRLAAGVATLLAASFVMAFWQLQPADSALAADGAGAYDLPALDGTVADGATTNSPLLRLLLGNAVPKVEELVSRQERQVRDYRQTALGSLHRQRDRISGPDEGERAILMQSDMHCNSTMISLQGKVAETLRSRYGEQVPALLAITGDLTTNGTAAEGGCIKDEADISGPARVVAVTGNHESQTSAQQMRQAGMEVLDGATKDVAGVSVLGDGDPARTELFGPTRLSGGETEEEMGQRLYQQALEDRPDMVLVHEAYAAQAFVGVDGMNGFLDGRGSPTRPSDDGVRDLPAGALFYGHWHRSVEPRVVWNSDGTWTLVMELDTSGGAIDSPTISHFSTPWSRPQQEASFPVVFSDEDSGLVTGYQIYSFETDGTVTVEPRVDVGVTAPVGAAPAEPAAPAATAPRRPGNGPGRA